MYIDHIHEHIRARVSPRVSELARFRSTGEMEEGAVYRELAADIGEALTTIDQGDFRTGEASSKRAYRFVAWNIERGIQVARQIEEFQSVGYLRDADVVCLTEVDAGMARSGNVHVARLMARELGWSYAFAPCYLNLVKGTGLEREAAGDNDLGLHGNALLSRYPIRDARLIALPNGVDKMAGNEKRIGAQNALAATVDLPSGPVTVVCEHFDVLASQRHRASQMEVILAAVHGDERVVLGGDWNTNTFNGSRTSSRLFGILLRAFMGVGRTIREHSLHPERFFEREMFRLLEARGYNYRAANCLGEHTARYDICDARSRASLAEWNPTWGFALVRWALRNHDGCCPMKLDWFAVRNLRASDPVVLHEKRQQGVEPLSDHAAIGVDVSF